MDCVFVTLIKVLDGPSAYDLVCFSQVWSNKSELDSKLDSLDGTGLMVCKPKPMVFRDTSDMKPYMRCFQHLLGTNTNIFRVVLNFAVWVYKDTFVLNIWTHVD